MQHFLQVFSDWLSLDLKTKYPCELFVDKFPTKITDSKKILLVAEPDSISHIKHHVIKYSKNFELILTFDKDILTFCKNSKLFTFGTSWIQDFNIEKEKEYCVTTLVGGKLLTYNHLLRQSLVTVRNKITSIPFHIFNSKNNSCNIPSNYKKITNSLIKNELFYSQYHIAIENSVIDNYFTEKLIDCFQTKTIPIYLGCPNIGNFFDNRGIIQVKDVNDIITTCNLLNENTYDSMTEYINNNYEISKEYLSIETRLKFEITKFLNNL